VEGAVANGVSAKDAAYIFELVDKFAGYGFNKSHAAAYALVAYHTAYLKANYREEFLAASMTLDMANTDKLAMFTAEAIKSGIPVQPPCVNASKVDFSVEPPPQEGSAQGSTRPIRYALAALKNVGESAVQTIVAARDADGPFADLSDFARRLNPKAVNRRALEMLAAAGAFESLGVDRATMAANAEPVLALANRLASNAEQGTDDLFGGGGGGAALLDLKPARAWAPMERLEKEFSAVGFFLSGHPLDEYSHILTGLGVRTYQEFAEAVENGGISAGKLAGIVVSARVRKSQKGNPFAFATFSDTTGQFEAIVFSDTLNACRSGKKDLLEAGTPVVVGVEAERDPERESIRMRVNSVEALETVARNAGQTLLVQLDPLALSGDAGRSVLGDLPELLKPGKGEIRIAMTLFDAGKEITLKLPGKYETSPHVRGALVTLPGVVDVVQV